MTPAIRLGLARGPVASEDIVCLTPEPPARRRVAKGIPTTETLTLTTQSVKLSTSGPRFPRG